MCGTVGFIDYKKQSSEALLSEMSETLVHRGPDDSGLEFWRLQNANIGLAHRRLSIQDISNLGHQPMKYEHLTIAFNGEVYNFKEIRSELITLGYHFDSKTDTEVILKSYYEWGSSCVDKFRGMFAISIFDSKLGKLILIRDRAGIKPLYYTITEESIVFASELKAIVKYNKFEKKIDSNALSCFLEFGYIHAPMSIYENVYKLPPASYLEYDIQTSTFQINKYWDITKHYLNKRDCSDPKKIESELESLLIESFSLRMISDRPVGVFLSGGVDSSLITAVLQKYSSSTINTFSIGFEDENYNEAPHAKKIADYLGTNHEEFICRKEDAQSVITELPKMYDEPFADSSAIPTTLVSRLAGKKVSVVLSGDGGDELFAGYIAYTSLAKRLDRINKMPLKKAISWGLGFIPDPIFKLNAWNERIYTKYLRFKNVITVNGVVNSYKAASSVFTECEIQDLLTTNNRDKTSDKVSITNIFGLHVSEQMMISDYNYYLSDDLLVKVDRATMSVSIEGREPLLDHKIAEYAASLPLDLKKEKRILKAILSKYIPDELFIRKKQGFGIPINQWIRTDLNHLLSEYFSTERIISQGIFDPKYINKLIDLFLSGKNDDRKVWTLLMFQMWYYENF